jgi:GT2 family glycosyltransferase
LLEPKIIPRETEQLTQPSVCIIIVHYKGLDILKKCLESVFSTNYRNFQVTLVDNGSNDGSNEFVARFYDRKIRLIRSDVNLGFVAGNNLALRQVSADYIVLLNDDVIVDPGWLVELVYEAEEDRSIGACQPKLRSLQDPKYFEYNGACGGMLDIYGVPLTRGRIFDLAEKDSGQYDKTAEIFWASGAALFLRDSVIREVGLLDEMFYAHMEEIDLCWRMRLAGYRVLSVPKSTVYHLGGGTMLPEKFYLKQRNNLITIIKNYGTWSLLRFLPLRMVQDLFSFTYYMIKKEKARSLPILTAYYWLLKNLHSVLISRYITQKRRKVKDNEIIDIMVKKSVAIQHYLLKRKYFSQLSGLPRNLKYYMAKHSDASV